jgi:hypothetical protein
MKNGFTWLYDSGSIRDNKPDDRPLGEMALLFRYRIQHRSLYTSAVTALIHPFRVLACAHLGNPDNGWAHFGNLFPNKMFVLPL